MAFFNGFFPPVLEPEVPISREKKSLLRFAKGSDEFVTKKKSRVVSARQVEVLASNDTKLKTAFMSELAHARGHAMMQS